MTGFVIVVLKGDNISEKGQIIQVDGSITIQEFKALAAKKLGILNGLGTLLNIFKPDQLIYIINLLLFCYLELFIKDESDNKLESIQEITKNSVVVVEPAEFIREIRGPIPLPLVGNLFDLIPDM